MFLPFRAIGIMSVKLAAIIALAIISFTSSHRLHGIPVQVHEQNHKKILHSLVLWQAETLMYPKHIETSAQMCQLEVSTAETERSTDANVSVFNMLTKKVWVRFPLKLASGAA